MLTSFRIIERKEATELQIDEFVFSGGGGFLLGTARWIRYKESNENSRSSCRFVCSPLAYLAYKGLIDVKWVAMENVTRSAVE